MNDLRDKLGNGFHRLGQVSQLRIRRRLSLVKETLSRMHR